MLLTKELAYPGIIKRKWYNWFVRHKQILCRDYTMVDNYICNNKGCLYKFEDKIKLMRRLSSLSAISMAFLKTNFKFDENLK
jgi:hypothetical protein